MMHANAPSRSASAVSSPLVQPVMHPTLGTPPEMHVVPHMGHYEFLAPCSPAMAEKLPAICAHEPGFDPVAFHRSFNRAVVGFFERSLASD